MGTETWQRLDTLARRATPAAVTFMLTLLGVVPLHVPVYGPVAPLFPLMAVYYWSIHRPDLMPYSVVFLIGLVHDILTGSPIGVHSLLFLTVHAALSSQQRHLAGRSFLVLWCGFVLVAGVTMAMEWLIHSVYYLAIMPVEAAGFRMILTIALYPPVAWGLSTVQRSLLRSPSNWRADGS